MLIPLSTWIWLIAIAVVFVICLYLIEQEKFKENRRMVEFFPTLVSTIGVLGTFYGITSGLLAFDSIHLDESIPKLLDGLKTAFFTSLAGMVGSMILSAYLNKKQDENDGGVSDANQAAAEICKAVKEMSAANKSIMEELKTQLENSENSRNAFFNTMGSAIEAIKNTQNTFSNNIVSLLVVSRSQDTTLGTLKENSASMMQAIGNLEEFASSQKDSLDFIQSNSKSLLEDTRHLGEVATHLEGINTTSDLMSENIANLKDVIHGEITQIEDDMEKTNKLLEKKFDEFTELLKKSNTEALVEVMKNVTKEFQKQMDALISKLIQENFEQLNKSVERLNQWQQDNKEMIASLTQQYKEMSENFEATSDSLTKVKDDTTSLVSEGGKLRQLVDALNQVIIEDEKFIKVTNELHDTAILSKSNMEAFDESTKALNDWVRKQRHFVDGVTELIAKLEELNSIRNYSDQFWKETREGMNDGVNIIKQGSQTLNRQLTSLDQQFYGRLSATLAELDNCITKMVEKVSNRR